MTHISNPRDDITTNSKDIKRTIKKGYLKNNNFMPINSRT